MPVVPNIAGPLAAKSFIRRCSATNRFRGDAWIRKRAVKILPDSTADRIVAAIASRPRTTATLIYENGSWTSECSSCSVPFCAHAYATMKAALGTTEGDPPSDFIQRVSAAHGTRLSDADLRIAKGLVRIFKEFSRTGIISLWQIQDILPSFPGRFWEPLNLWPSPPRSVDEMWLYFAHAMRREHRPIPNFLEPVTDFEAISGPLRNWMFTSETENWLERLRTIATATDLECALVEAQFCVQLGPQGLMAGFSTDLQAPPSDFAFKKGPIQKNFDRLKPAPGPSHVIWLALEPCPDISFSDSSTLRAINHLLRDPELVPYVLTDAKVPFERPADPLRWSVSPRETPAGTYHRIELLQSNGEPAPPPFLILRGQPTLYVTAQAVFEGPRPVFSKGIETQVDIPAPALETNEGVAWLNRAGLPLPASIEQLIETVPLTVNVYASLGPLYPRSTTEVVMARIVGEAPRTGYTEELTQAGWRVTSNKLKDPGKRRIYNFDRARSEAFHACMIDSPLKFDPMYNDWRLRVTRNFPQNFLAWLESLPESVDLHLKGELASLVHQPVKAGVSLECEQKELDWFDLSVVVKPDDTNFTPEELNALLAASGKWVRLKGKGWRRLEFDISDEDQEIMAKIGLDPSDFSGERQRLHSLQLADPSASKLLPPEHAEQIRRRVEELKTSVKPPLPASLRADLRPYQVDGFNFLAYLAENRFGGILADDMGLGKTLQALAWILWLREQNQDKPMPCLVVCPKSVAENWQNEAARFAPTLRVVVARGTEPEIVLNDLSATDILVINYAQLRVMAKPLAGKSWLAAVLDEGQYVKNPTSQTALAAYSLSAQYRLVLSGTPVENRLLDLWSLMSFAMPGILGNRAKFSRSFDRSDNPLAMRRLAARVRPFLLRRTKQQVARDLPDRVLEEIHCELEGQQLVHYRAEMKRAQQILLNVQTTKDLDKFRFHFLASLLRLRQICCHPGLLSPELRNLGSAKLEALLDLLDPILAEGQKVLVFSQFVEMLRIIQDAVQQRQWTSFTLTGATENRGDLVESFQSHEGPAVFLISLRAGGFGLNLTAASYVVLFDPWWNPAVEQQAIDRTHRIGQTSTVFAYRLLTKNSIEEKIRLLQQSKSALADDILGGEEGFAKNLSVDDLRFLFSDADA